MANESSRTVLFTFLCLGLRYFVTLTIAFDPFFRPYCRNNTGDYTVNSAYKHDLDSTFKEILSITRSNYGFYGKKFGEVNAIALCRGDVKRDVCITCLKETISRLKSKCVYRKEATGWSELCTLSYSSRNISLSLERSPICQWDSISRADDHYQFLLGQLLNDLIYRAAAGDTRLKYATSSSSLSGSRKVYALVQCTPDLSQPECIRCLSKAREGMGCCTRKMGCRVLLPRCNLRFNSSPFFDAVPDVPRIQEETKGNQPKWIPALAASLSAAMVSAGGFYIWRRGNKQSRSNLEGVTTNNLPYTSVKKAWEKLKNPSL